MDFWKYYAGNKSDLPPIEVIYYSFKKELAVFDPKWAYEYARKNGPFPEGEAMIAKSTKYSIWYALNILQKKFPLGEPAIAKDPKSSYNYANMILNGPFPLGEKAIATDENYAQIYTIKILKKDFILNGKLICKYEG